MELNSTFFLLKGKKTILVSRCSPLVSFPPSSRTYKYSNEFEQNQTNPHHCLYLVSHMIHFTDKEATFESALLNSHSHHFKSLPISLSSFILSLFSLFTHNQIQFKTLTHSISSLFPLFHSQFIDRMLQWMRNALRD